MAYSLTQQLIRLLPGGQAELTKVVESETRQRASFIKETADANHDHDYKALCRFFINDLKLCFDILANFYFLSGVKY